jgi:opacity protein-like surface antigen
MVERPLIAAGIAFACFAAPAFGADLPPEAPPIFTWSGFYAGFNNGYAWRDSGAFNTSAICSIPPQSLAYGGRRRLSAPQAPPARV